MDETTQLNFAADGVGTLGTCHEGDEMTLQDLLRAADVGLNPDDEHALLDTTGGLKLSYRDTGAVLHAKIVYSNDIGNLNYNYQVGPHLSNQACTALDHTSSTL